MTSQYQFDEDKRETNIEKHGVDFYDAALIFEGPILRKVDNRKDYGEIRFVALGLVDGEPFTVVYTERNDAIRIISAWRSGESEYERYKNTFP